MAGNIPEFSLISNVFIVIVLLFVVSVKYDIQNWSKTYNLFGKLNVKMESEARKEKIAEKQQITYKEPQNQFKVFHSLLWRRAHSFHYFGIHIQSQYHNEIKRIVGTGIQHAYLNRSVDISDDKGKNNKNKAILMEIGQVACMAEHWKLEHCKRFAEFFRFFFLILFLFRSIMAHSQPTRHTNKMLQMKPVHFPRMYISRSFINRRIAMVSNPQMKRDMAE